MKTVWLTGASSGIGEACAYEFARKGCRLILTASRPARLEEVAAACLEKGAAGVLALPFDLSQEEGLEELSSAAWDAFGGIDILFCNAGISQRTSVLDTSMPMVRKIMEVNFFAPAAITRCILPFMLSRGGGHICVTTSIAGRFGFPLRCAYSASKHALYGYFETLRSEYASQGIGVTIVCPGRVRTNISFNALDKDGRKHAVMDPGQDNGISPEKAASKIIRAIDRRKEEVLIGGGELLMVYVKRFFPRICSRLSRRIRPV